MKDKQIIEIIDKVMKEEVCGLNPNFNKNSILFSYFDVIEILERALRLKEKK